MQEIFNFLNDYHSFEITTRQSEVEETRLYMRCWVHKKWLYLQQDFFRKPIRLKLNNYNIENNTLIVEESDTTYIIVGDTQSLCEVLDRDVCFESMNELEYEIQTNTYLIDYDFSGKTENEYYFVLDMYRAGDSAKIWKSGLFGNRSKKYRWLTGMIPDQKETYDLYMAVSIKDPSLRYYGLWNMRTQEVASMISFRYLS